MSGFVWRRHGITLNWTALFDDVLGKLELADDDTNLPAHRPKRPAKLIRDIMVEMELGDLIMVEEAARAAGRKPNPVESIVAAAADKFGLSERTVWNIYRDESLPEYAEWFGRRA